eukprot:gene9594-biopygen6781
MLVGAELSPGGAVQLAERHHRRQLEPNALGGDGAAALPRVSFWSGMTAEARTLAAKLAETRQLAISCVRAGRSSTTPSCSRMGMGSSRAKPSIPGDVFRGDGQVYADLLGAWEVLLGFPRVQLPKGLRRHLG